MSKGHGITIYCGKTNLDLSKCLKPCILKGPFKFAIHFGRRGIGSYKKSIGKGINPTTPNPPSLS